jgi:uncharacterized protein with von Willebrand factor type A (vWA) domain
MSPAGGDAPGPESALTARVSALAHELRARGVRVGIGEVLTAHRALAAVDVASRADVFLALRTVLCSASGDLALFAEAFTAVFGLPAQPGAEPDEDETLSRSETIPPALPGDDEPDDGEETEAAAAAWSDVELLRAKDFAAYTDEERAAARRLVARLGARAPKRRSRRTRRAHGRAAEFDVRESVRRSLRYEGELIERCWRTPAERPRRLILLCDVSGSMAAYSRLLLHYAQACVAAQTRVEAFVFGTRLTRLTRELSGRDPDAAIARATKQVSDWSGGTRIGAALAQLNREHGRRIGRGAVIVILSDGWDQGDPGELGTEMARLRRCSHRLLWLNPLAADPRYEPLTRGILAALPHVDQMLPGNSIASLEQLSELLESGMGSGGSRAGRHPAAGPRRS